jgi:hypothetical protein
MKFIEPRLYADTDSAARKLLEIANAAEAVQDGRLYIERINWTVSERSMADPLAAIAAAMADGRFRRSRLSGDIVGFGSRC